MPLETGTYIDDLNKNNPLGSESKSKGDDHIRLIKKTIKNTFPNVDGACNPTPAEFNILDGATLSTAELNTLDGFTGSTSDLNLIANIVITAQGDLVVGDGSGNASRLALGSSGQVLRSNGTSAAWSGLGADSLDANSVGTSEIASSAVAQSELKTTTGVTSRTSNGVSKTTLAGGQYGFYPNVQYDAVDSSSANQYLGVYFGRADHDGSTSNEEAFTSELRRQSSDGSLSYGAYAVLVNATGNLKFHVDVRQRYVQASPPYNLGNGDIPMFVFAEVDKSSGSILSMWAAEDPPWANNGPTDIRPHVVLKGGRKYRYASRAAVTMRDVLSGAADMDDLIAARAEAKTDLEEITQERKNRDMGLIPHPWFSVPKSSRVIMLDPLSEVVGAMREFNSEGEDIVPLFTGPQRPKGSKERVRIEPDSGYIRLGNTVDAAAPPGVLVCRCDWKR